MSCKVYAKSKYLAWFLKKEDILHDSCKKNWYLGNFFQTKDILNDPCKD